MISAGLTKVMADTPVRSAYIELQAGATRAGAYGRLEGGARPWKNVSLFGYGAADTVQGWSAGLGARAEWTW